MVSLFLYRKIETYFFAVLVTSNLCVVAHSSPDPVLGRANDIHVHDRAVGWMLWDEGQDEDDSKMKITRFVSI